MQNLIGKVILAIGTTAERMSVVIESGRPCWDTDTEKLYIGDGTTLGGVMINYDDSNLSSLIQDVEDALAQEVTNRTNADTTLQTNITNEATARSSADTALGVRIDGVQSDLSDEEDARIAADTTLQANITAEATTRLAEDNDLSDRIDDEQDLRIAADTTLQTNINNEATARATAISTEATTRLNADNALDLRIDGVLDDLSTETSARESADATLQTNITNEATTRASADTTLQTNINNEATARANADNALDARLDTAEATLLLKADTTYVDAADGVLQDNIDLKAAITYVDAADAALQDAIDLKANTADLADVATSGDYNDLINLPSIPDAQVNSDWNATSGVTQILNKPTTLTGFGITDAINVSQKGANNGVATLDSNGKIPVSQIPATAINDVFTVASEAAQLALTAQVGDVARRTDESKTYIHNGGTSGTMADWSLVLSPEAAVTTVNGQVGDVVLDKSDVGLANVDNTSDANKPVSTATQTALDLKAAITYVDAADAALQDAIDVKAAITYVDSADQALQDNIDLKANTADLADVATSGDYNDLINTPTIPVTSVAGKTGAVTLDKSDVGLANVDNTSDANKPVSTATQTALDGKQNTFTSQTANTIFAAPDGTNGTPSFRALLASDIPSLNYVAPTRTITAGTGLTGGGDLSANRSISLNSSTITSLSKADTALQSVDIGTSIQAYSANLTDWAGISISSKVNTGAITSSGLTMATASILGRTTAGTGGIEAISIGSGLTLSSGTLSANGTSAGGSSGQIQYNSSGAFAGATDAVIQGNQLRLNIPSSTPSTPSANGLKLYSQSIGGRMLMATMEPTGQTNQIQNAIGTKSLCWVQSSLGTSPNSFGIVLTSTGTANAVSWASTNYYSKVRRFEYIVSTPATNAVAGWRSSNIQYTIGSSTSDGVGGFHYVHTWGPAIGVSTTTNRGFVGLTNTTSAPTDVEPSSITNIIGMGWDAADTNLQIIYRGTGSVNKIDLGSGFPVSTTDRTDVYRLEMYSPSSTTQSVSYIVRNMTTGAVASGTITTNLPSTTTALAPRGWMSVGGTSSVIGIAIMNLYIETDY